MKVAILAGGSGTRLWPLSREDYPKQFIRINSQFSFFQNTILRILKKFEPQDILISSHKKYKFHTLSDLVKVIPQGKSLPHLIFEPESKNTFGALLAIINFSLNKLNVSPEEILLILPSDHLIKPENKFHLYLDLAQKYAGEGKIVVFGVKAQSESQGYGYIKAGKKINSAFRVERFVEKPSLEVAKDMLAQGSCFWNSGIFCFQIGTILQEIDKCYPQLTRYLKLNWEKFQENFKKLPAISIDNAIMEKTEKAVVIPLEDLYWNDIGSFDALYEILGKDSKGNVKIGNVALRNVQGSFLLSNRRLVSAIGIKDLLIIETDDALLIVPKNEAQRVKDLVAVLKANKKREVFEHLTHYRPWGSFTILEEGPRYKIKHVIVNPQESLSLQVHHHRSEHWVIIKGMAKVRIGEIEKFIPENESAYVPKSTVHQLENPGKVELELIEVQNGEYLGEDDIERLEDRYQELR